MLETLVGILNSKDFDLCKDKIKFYQYNTKVAQHYFCGNCGIYTHHIPRSAPEAYGINVGCIEGVDPLKLKDVNFFDGENHPLDQKNNFFSAR